MFARVSMLQGASGMDTVDKALASARDDVLPAAQKMQGFKGMMALGDAGTGKVMAITFWETDEDLRASEEAANALREAAAEDSAAEIAEVDRFEVLLNSMG